MHSFAPAPTIEEIEQFSDVEPENPTLMAVPAYFGPWATEDWEALLASEPGVIVINPDSGPGERKSASYATLVRQAQRRGFAVIGYCSLARGKRKYAECLAELDAYRDWYEVDGMFWDEVKVTTRPSGLLRSLYGVSVRKFGLDGFIVYNPGTAVPEGFFSSLRRAYIVTFEGSRAQHVERFGAFEIEVEGPIERQWHLIHSCAPKFQRTVRQRLVDSGLGGAYVTHATMPNPWDVFVPQ